MLHDSFLNLAFCKIKLLATQKFSFRGRAVKRLAFCRFAPQKRLPLGKPRRFADPSPKIS